MSHIRTSMFAIAAAATLTFGGAGIAVAGGSGGGPVEDISIPTGFASAYVHQHDLVVATCNAKPATVNRAMKVVAARKIIIDRQLAAAGLQPTSPTYYDFANEGFDTHQAPNCPKG